MFISFFIVCNYIKKNCFLIMHKKCFDRFYKNRLRKACDVVFYTYIYLVRLYRLRYIRETTVDQIEFGSFNYIYFERFIHGRVVTRNEIASFKTWTIYSLSWKPGELSKTYDQMQTRERKYRVIFLENTICVEKSYQVCLLDKHNNIKISSYILVRMCVLSVWPHFFSTLQ